MNSQDELIQFFKQEKIEQYEKYMSRLSLCQFKLLNTNILQSQFYFLNTSQLPYQKANQLRITHAILDIEGSKMRSIINQQIYSIFCEAPSKLSQQIFWKTCFIQKISTIFMILPNIDKYWPEDNEQIKFENGLTIIGIKKHEQNIYIELRQFLLLYNQQKRIIFHYHYKQWFDGKIPYGIQNCIIFRSLIQKAIQIINKEQIILIHCKAGIGRTGVFGATIEAVRCLQKLGVISLFQIVANMRNYRQFCIFTYQQYQFIHTQAILFDY